MILILTLLMVPAFYAIIFYKTITNFSNFDYLNILIFFILLVPIKVIPFKILS